MSLCQSFSNIQQKKLNIQKSRSWAAAAAAVEQEKEEEDDDDNDGDYDDEKKIIMNTILIREYMYRLYIYMYTTHISSFDT